MQLPRAILVPVDFSEYSEPALDYAVALAAKLDARVHVLHVVGIPALGVPELGVAFSESAIDAALKATKATLEELVVTYRGKAPIGDILVCTGEAHVLINQTAEEVHADLIVMGTHGRRGLSRALLGSVAESVVRTARCAVLTLRAKRK